jgi:hypothetical protein
MVYTEEIPVDILLRRLWIANDSAIDRVCEYLPQTHQSSYINTVWSFRAKCADTSRAHPDLVLRTGLWFRHTGFDLEDPNVREVIVRSGRQFGFTHTNLADPDVRARVNATLGGSLLQHSLVLKSMKLAFAIMSVGFVPSRTHTNPIDSNLKILRLLSQGPWPKLGFKLRSHIEFQLKNSFNMLLIEAAIERNRRAMEDLQQLEKVYAYVYEKVMELGTWQNSTWQDFDEICPTSMSITAVLPNW